MHVTRSPDNGHSEMMAHPLSEEHIRESRSKVDQWVYLQKPPYNSRASSSAWLGDHVKMFHAQKHRHIWYGDDRWITQELAAAEGASEREREI